MQKYVLLSLFLYISSSILGQPINLEVRAYTQGFYSQSASAMVPVADPVNFPTLCDTATIVIIDSVSGQGIFCSQSAFSVNGFGSVTLPGLFFGNAYLVGVRFRNTLHIISKNAILFDSLNMSVDLTIPDNLCCSFDTTFGVAKAYSGDVNRDGAIDVTDVNMVDTDRNLSVTGYVITDLNGDRIVDAADVAIAWNNSNLFLFDDYNGLCQPTGIDTRNLPALSAEVFPNPFSGKFTIRIQELYQKIDLNIFDISGKLCFSKNFEMQQELLINQENLTPGIYFLQLIADNKRAFIKLIAY